MSPRSISVSRVLFAFLPMLLVGCPTNEQAPAPPPPDAQVPDAMPGCPPGSLGCPCAEGGCVDGLVCDEETDRCRDPLACACVQYQQCAAVDGQDPQCLDACEPGYDWDPIGARCIEDVCDPAAPGSIAAACAEEHRVCEPPGRCGGCLPGHAPSDAGCEPILDCAALDCEASQRGCVDDGERPRCDGCLAGWVEFGGECVADTCALSVPGSTARDCAARHRVCVDGDGPVCGACVAGRREALDGACVPLVECDALGCADQGRICTPADGATRADARCGACLPGLVEADGACVPDRPMECDDVGIDDAGVVTPSMRERCAELGRGCVAGMCSDACIEGWRTTPGGARCVPVVDCAACAATNRLCDDGPQGARCGDCAEGHRLDGETGACVPDCPAPDQVRHPLTGACVTACDPAGGCAADGEACRPVGEAGVHVCGPDCGDGLFNGVGCVACPPCDRIDLGEAGRAPELTANGRCICETTPGHYYSVAGEIGPRRCDVDGDRWLTQGAQVAMESADPVLRARARCTPVEVEAVELVAWDGRHKVVWLERPVVLYESARNDDPQRLREAFDADAVPRTLINAGYDAARLNGLTRLCHTARADYDDDGVADVDAPSGVAAPGASQTMRILGRFAHFAELHHLGINERDGVMTLRIEEKRRDTIGLQVQFLEMEDGAESLWQTCTARRDARYDPRTPQPGFDFADVPADAAFGGMTHHSMFRCLSVRNVAEPDALHMVEPRSAADDYALSRATGAGFEAVLDRPAAGEALWGVARYQHGQAGLQLARDYRFGCVNECAEYRSNPLEPPASLGDARCDRAAGQVYLSCQDQPGRFGRVRCEGVPCNGVDDDGDGDTDEFGGLADSVDDFAGACLTGELGACGIGSYVCDGAIPVCNVPGRRLEVACNAVDEDCDGELDEDPLGECREGEPCDGGPDALGRRWDVLTYGGRLLDLEALQDARTPPQLGARCSRGLGVCETEARLLCTQTRGAGLQPICREGDADAEDTCRYNSRGPRSQCVALPAPDAESCDGLDNDCDGTVDEALGPPDDVCNVRRCLVDAAEGLFPSACALGAYSCTENGDVCQPLYGSADNPRGLPTLDEICNGIDDDCDTAIDEGAVCRHYIRLGAQRVDLTRTAGDNEFASNGPRVTIDLTLSTRDNRVEMNVDVQMQEVGGDSAGGFERNYSASLPGNPRLVLSPGMLSQIDVSYTDNDWDLDELYPVSSEANLVGPANARITPDRDRPLNISCNGDRDGNDLDGHADCYVHLDVAVERVPVAPGLDTCGNGVCDANEVCDHGNVCGARLCNATCTRRLGDDVPVADDEFIGPRWCGD